MTKIRVSIISETCFLLMLYCSRSSRSAIFFRKTSSSGAFVCACACGCPVVGPFSLRTSDFIGEPVCCCGCPVGLATTDWGLDATVEETGLVPEIALDEVGLLG